MRTVFLAILVFTGIFVTLSGQTRTKYTISGFSRTPLPASG
ncbi:MAG: hypothetical protein R3C41_16730 [Calditrichia bacterium]